MRRTAPRLTAAAVLLAAAASCGGDDGPDETPGASPGTDTSEEAEGRPFAVETLSTTFVDETRPSEDPSGTRSAPTRTLDTDLYVPDGPGPFPLVVHLHGFDGHAGKYTELLTAWAEAGYVVAAPTFPLTNDLDAGTGVFGDYTDQPADVAFVIEQVLELSSDDHPVLAGRVDEDRIGVSGHSLGGITAYGLVYNDCCQDGWGERIDAVTVMSGLPLDFDGSYTFEGAPLLLILTTGDPVVPYDQAVATYDDAASPKYLLRLDSAEHSAAYEDTPSDHDEVVRDATVAFWDLHLHGDGSAASRLDAAADTQGSAELDADP